MKYGRTASVSMSAISMFSLAARSGGGEIHRTSPGEQVPTSTTAMNGSKSEPHQNATSGTSLSPGDKILLDNLEFERNKFETKLKSGSATIFILMRTCAVIQPQPNGEIYTIPNPGFIESVDKNTKRRAIEAVAYNGATESLVYGQITIVDGKGNRITPSSSYHVNENDFLYNGLELKHPEVKINATHVVDANTDATLMTVAGIGSQGPSRSFEQFAHGGVGTFACDLLFNDQPTNA